jgi:small subunit ribosomal protein S16
MLVIRLSRTGSKKRPFFRFVVSDSARARDSRFVEILGHYNPRTKPATVEVDRARVDHWIEAGALPSDTVRTLLAGYVTKTIGTSAAPTAPVPTDTTATPTAPAPAGEATQP